MHIYLMGYRGAGKTTVAELLAQALDLPMIDTDDWIEAAEGRTIKEIFVNGGESEFRDIEQSAIAQIAKFSQDAVVALGGGAVLRQANQSLILSTGQRVWLRASPERLYSRIQADSSSPDRRPSLTDKSGFDEVVKVLAERTPIYELLSELTVDTDGQTPDHIVEIVRDWIRSRKSAGH